MLWHRDLFGSYQVYRHMHICQCLLAWCIHVVVKWAGVNVINYFIWCVNKNPNSVTSSYHQLPWSRKVDISVPFLLITSSDADNRALMSDIVLILSHYVLIRTQVSDVSMQCNITAATDSVMVFKSDCLIYEMPQKSRYFCFIWYSNVQ